jgi:mono/diheme cytochrome c family protein
MKSTRLRVAFSVLVPLACAAVLAARMEVLQAGFYAPDGFGQITQSAPVALEDGSSYAAAVYPAFPIQLAEGAGRGETQISCNTCHTVRYITMQPPLPAATWDAEVHKMIKTYGGQISDADAQKIIQYLQTHYTPETRK